MANQGVTTVGSIDAKIGMDLDQWRAGVAEIQASARALGSLSPDITVDANTGRAEAALAAVDATARAAGDSATTSAAKFVVNAEAESKLGTEGAQAAVKVTALDRAQRSAADAAALQAGAEGGNAAAITRTGDAASGAASHTQLIIAGVVALIALAGPLSAAAAGIGGGFAGMGAAGVLAIVGVVQAMKQGDAAGRQYSSGLKTLKGDLDALAGTAANGLLSSFQQGVVEVNAEMPELNSEISTFSTMLGGAAARALQGVLSLLRVGNPLFVQGAQVVSSMADGFARWTQDGGLQRFVTYAEQELPHVVHTLGDVGSMIGHVVEATAPIGSTVLSVLDGLSQVIGGIPVPVLTGAAAAAVTMWAAFKLGNGVGSIVDRVSASVSRLAGSEAEASAGAAKLGTSLGSVAGWFGVVTAAVGIGVTAVDAWKQSTEDAVASSDKLENSIKAGTDAAGGYTDAMKAVNAWNDTGTTTTRQMSDALESASSGWGGMNQAAANWLGTLDGGASVSGNVLNMLNKYGDSLGTVARTDLPQAVTSFKKFSEQYDLNATQQWRAINNMGQFKDALTTQATAMGVSASKSNLLAIANGTLTQANSQAKSSTDLAVYSVNALKQADDAAASATDQFAQALEGLGQVNLSADQANIKYQQSLADLTASVNANGKGLDESTDAGRKNMTALDGIATSAHNLISAQAAAGVQTDALTANMASARQSFIDAAVAAGDTTDQANALADQYGLIPSTVPTTFQTSGAQDAIDAANKVKAAYDAINKFITIRVNSIITNSTNPNIGFGLGDGHAAGGKVGKGRAAGGQVTGPGSAASDTAGLYYPVSNSEWIISNLQGQSSKWNSMLSMVNANAPAGQIAGKAMQIAGVQAPAAAPQKPVVQHVHNWHITTNNGQQLFQQFMATINAQNGP